MKDITLLMFAIVTLTSCAPVKYETYDEVIEREFNTISISDGVNESEAIILGNRYLLYNAKPLHTGHHPAAIDKVTDSKDYWKGEILVGSIAGMLPIPWIEPIYINKSDGSISWKDEGISQSEVRERSINYMQSNQSLKDGTARSAAP